MSKATITSGDKSITGDEESRQDHTALDLFELVVTGGASVFWRDPTPDTVTVRTNDGTTHRGPEKK